MNMKKTVSLMLGVVLSVSFIAAQSVTEGIKYLNYEFKKKTATDVLKKAYDANSKDGQTIYWYGQALLANGDVAGAKALYQQALQGGVNDAWVIVGMANIDMIGGADINAVKQKFEQAITMSTETKGKNKGKVNAGVINAIGRANIDAASKTKDIPYAIDKMKLGAAADLTNADILVNLGVAYLKLGGENGGEAVKAFQEAATRDPKNAEPKYRMGRIYYSQNNAELFLPLFSDAIAADANFPPVYYTLYDYYKDKDVNKAKDNLEKFIASADKDPNNDLLYADYLFRAGKYNESLAKAKEIETSFGTANVPRLNIIYAYDYDRLGDSVQAKAYAEKFFAAATQDNIQPSDYEFAVKVFSKFPGNEATSVSYIEKALSNDTLTADRIKYTKLAADIWGKAQNYPEQFKWLSKSDSLKTPLSNTDFFYWIDAAIKAKDTAEATRISNIYIQQFPDQIYGYRFKAQSAVLTDVDTTKGTALPALEQYITFLSKDSIKNQRLISSQFYYMASYYADKAKDFPKALEVVNRLLVYYPDDKFGLQVKPILEKAIAQQSKQPASKTGGSGNPKK
ncbi:hypothetical protein F5148DRAFT_1345740 [Russula earlei]|uniref:Uncharacterized protein n=1 Tax=Russula earlei TaxID=71964 RepID=A0ACC0TT76_9AGAM|nr:hypothetical protein F5148DRAFT_1345740 [Russula earlei]